MLLKYCPLLAVVAAIMSTAVNGELCILGQFPVTKCGGFDITKANWDAFHIDDFLFSMIRQFGTSDNFPKFILSQLTPKGVTGNTNFDCSNIEDPRNCQIKPAVNPHAGSCNFKGLAGTICLDFTSPEAGFLALNYLNMYRGLRNHFLAVRQAVDNLKSQNFISDVVDKLSPQKQPIGPAIFNLIADVVTDCLPIGGEIKAATTFMKKLKVVAKATKKDVKDDGKDIISVLESNSAIDKQAAATKDTLNQQLEAMAVGTQKRMAGLLAQIFGPNQDPTNPDDNAIRSTVAYQNAYHGGFLDDVPSQVDLQVQMEKQIKIWIATQIINVLGYACFVDATRLDDGFEPAGTVCRASGGFPIGAGCALFRIGSINGGGKEANDIFALTDLGIDMEDAINNARSCPKGSTVDFEGFLALENNSPLPKCMYTFPVSDVKL